MGYWTSDDLPFYHAMAGHFPIGDRYFCSVMAQTYPNRRFLIAGTALGNISTDGSGISTVDAPNGTIFDRLNDYGISWKDYYPDLPTVCSLRARLPRQSDQGGPYQPVLHRRGIGQPAGVQPRGSLHQLFRGGRGHFGGRGLCRSVHQCGDERTGLGEDALIWVYDEHGAGTTTFRPRRAVKPDNVPPELERRRRPRGL